MSAVANTKSSKSSKLSKAQARNEFETKMADEVLEEVMARLNIGECSAGSQISLEMLQQVAKEVSTAKVHEFVEKESKEKVKSSRAKKLEERPAEECCMARVWANGTDGQQCSSKRTKGDYCSSHHTKAIICETPCCFDEFNTRKGLFMGRIDQELPVLDPTGEFIVIFWEGPKGKAAVEEAKSRGLKPHPLTKEGGNGKTKKEKKPKAEKPKKEKKEKKPKKEDSDDSQDDDSDSEEEEEKPKKKSKSKSSKKSKKSKKADSSDDDSDSDSDSEKKSRKKKRATKETVGKRPKSGFLRFLDEKRAEIKANLPAELAKKVSEVAKRAGEMWKALSAEEQAVYNAPYEAEMKEWREANGIVSGEEKKKAPKKPKEEKKPEEEDQKTEEEDQKTEEEETDDMDEELEKQLGSVADEETEENAEEEEEEEEDEDDGSDTLFEHGGYKYFVVSGDPLSIYRMDAETGDVEADEDGYSKQFGSLKGDKVITEEGEVFGTFKDGVFTKQEPIKKKLLVKSAAASLKK